MSEIDPKYNWTILVVNTNPVRGTEYILMKAEIGQFTVHEIKTTGATLVLPFKEEFYRTSHEKRWASFILSGTLIGGIADGVPRARREYYLEGIEERQTGDRYTARTAPTKVEWNVKL